MPILTLASNKSMTILTLASKKIECNLKKKKKMMVTYPKKSKVFTDNISKFYEEGVDPDWLVIKVNLV